MGYACFCLARHFFDLFGGKDEFVHHGTIENLRKIMYLINIGMKRL
jgi:hypothetical protein